MSEDILQSSYSNTYSEVSSQEPQSEISSINPDLLNQLTSFSSLSSIPPSLQSEISSRRIILFRPEEGKKEAFLQWWETTEWGLAVKEKIPGFGNPQWLSEVRRSPSWESFIQGAEIRDGRPRIQCSLCSDILDHPRAKHFGNKAMKTHLESQRCRRKRPDTMQQPLTFIKPKVRIAIKIAI